MVVYNENVNILELSDDGIQSDTRTKLYKAYEISEYDKGRAIYFTPNVMGLSIMMQAMADIMTGLTNGCHIEIKDWGGYQDVYRNPTELIVNPNNYFIIIK